MGIHADSSLKPRDFVQIFKEAFKFGTQVVHRCLASPLEIAWRKVFFWAHSYMILD